MKEYYEQLQTNKSSNLEEIDVLLKGYKPPKLSPEKLDILSIHISAVCVLLDISGTLWPHGL